MEKLIKTRKKVSNEAYQAEAYDIAAKILRAIYARKESNISYKDHNSWMTKSNQVEKLNECNAHH